MIDNSEHAENRLRNTILRAGLMAGGLVALVLTILAPAALVVAAGEAFIEKNGLLVIEVESAPAVSDWSLQKGNAGYTGNGYYTWKKDDHNPHSISQGGSGTLEYRVKINNPGRFRLQIRSASPNGYNTEHNDVWFRSPDADAVAVKADSSSSVNLGRSWAKSYQNILASDWTWDTRNVDHNPHHIFVDFPTKGEYRVQLSGRSSRFMIDRFVLYNVNMITESQATNPNNPESGRGTGGDDGGGDNPDPVLPDTLQNAGFETAGAANRLASNWNAPSLATGSRRRCDKPAKDKTFSNTGQCAFQFKAQAGVSSRLIQRLNSMGLQNGSTLTVGAHVAGFNLSQGGRIVAVVVYSDGTPRSKAVINVPTGSYGYQQVNQSVNLTSSNIQRVILRIQMNGKSGRFLVDDVSLSTASGVRSSSSEAGELLPLPSAPQS